jgi:outer membrane protein TolC
MSIFSKRNNMNHQKKELSLWLRCLSAVVLFVVIPGSTVFGQSRQDTLTLKDCIQFTLQHHPNSSVYANNVALAKEKIRESRAALLPSVTGSIGVDYNPKLQTTIFPAGALSPQETKLQIGNKFSTGAYLEADQTLFDKSALLSVKAAKVDKEIADLNLLKQNETLIYNTSTAYYEVLTYGEKGKLLKENEEEYQQLIDILKLRYEQGVVKKSEYDRTRVNLNNIQSEIALNGNNYQLSLNKLKNAMGLEIQANLVVDRTVDYSTQVWGPMLPDDLNLTALTDYQIDARNLEQKEIDIRKKSTAFFPSASIYGKYGTNAYGTAFSNAFNSWFDYSVVGVRLSVPIFSGFKKSSQLRQSQLNVENQRLNMKLNTRSYQLDFQNAGSQLLNSYTSLKKNKENLDLAKEVLDASRIEYREGTATLSSYLDTDYSYKEAQTNYITSLLDFLNARIALEKARGTLTSYVNHLK